MKELKDKEITMTSGSGNFRAGAYAGAVAGTILGIEIAGMGDLLPYFRDTFILIAVVSSVCAVTFGTSFFVVRALSGVLFRNINSFTRKISEYRRTAAIFIIICPQAMLWLVEQFRPVSILHRPAIIGSLIAVAVLSAAISQLLSTGFSKLFPARKVSTARRLIYLSSYLVLLIALLGSISYALNHASVRAQAFKSTGIKERIILLGLDAADWHTISPLLEEGKLPNLQRVIREGSSGNLTSLVSSWGALAEDSVTFGIESPAIWTSILTGKEPWKHGIKDFFLTEIPLLEHPFRHRLIPDFVPNREHVERFLGLRVRPYTRFLRKSKAAWNIVSDAGAKAMALGWWDTWPAENINGDIVSDRLADPSLLRKWAPADAISQSDGATMMAELNSFPASDLAYFTDFPYDPQFKTKYGNNSYEYIRNELLTNFISNFLLDRFKSRIALGRMDQQRYDFMAVYYYASDVAGHAFTRFRQPQLFSDVDPRDPKYFGGILAKYYIWFDYELGKYLERVHDDATIIICSDHGMGPWEAVRSERAGVRLSGSHRKQGILILWGHNIRRGYRIEHASVLDILPTALQLMAMPVAKDMDGAVITEALDKRFLDSNPGRTIETYETKHYEYQYGPAGTGGHTGDQKEMDKLRSLGYIR
jgi:predicted AlkP superfamily phosphohydrolase/phosphomutase